MPQSAGWIPAFAASAEGSFMKKSMLMWPIPSTATSRISTASSRIERPRQDSIAIRKARSFARREREGGPILALSLLPAAGQAQTVDEIVAKNIQAKGGVEQLKAVKAMRITAHVSPGAGRPRFQMTITTERPNKLRQDSTMKGQQMVMAFDGDSRHGPSTR